MKWQSGPARILFASQNGHFELFRRDLHLFHETAQHEINLQRIRSCFSLNLSMIFNLSSEPNYQMLVLFVHLPVFVIVFVWFFVWIENYIEDIAEKESRRFWEIDKSSITARDLLSDFSSMNVCNGAFQIGPCKKQINESNTHALLSSAIISPFFLWIRLRNPNTLHLSRSPETLCVCRDCPPNNFHLQFGG